MENEKPKINKDDMKELKEQLGKIEKEIKHLKKITKEMAVILERIDKALGNAKLTKKFVDELAKKFPNVSEVFQQYEFISSFIKRCEKLYPLAEEFLFVAKPLLTDLEKTKKIANKLSSHVDDFFNSVNSNLDGILRFVTVYKVSASGTTGGQELITLLNSVRREVGAHLKSGGHLLWGQIVRQ